MDLKSSSVELQPRSGGRGIQEAQVWEAADALVQEGLRPTIERVRQKIGSGSPNTVSPMLERWFATLGKRLEGRAAAGSLAAGEAQQLPLAIVQAAQQFWDVARREADQVQAQKTEAARRELELERDALAQKDANLQQREAALAQARVALDEALASSRQAVAAMEAQMHAQQQESSRLLSDSEAEVRRLRKAVDEAVASKEALREKAAMELGAKQRAADEAEERHLAQERRLLSEVDRERMATRQAAADLAKEQKARAADLDAARAAQVAAQQLLHDEQSGRRADAAAATQQLQATHLELATQRERTTGAEQRATDLATQLQRQTEQSEREIAQLRESHATAAAALRQLQQQAGAGDQGAAASETEVEGPGGMTAPQASAGRVFQSLVLSKLGDLEQALALLQDNHSQQLEVKRAFPAAYSERLHAAGIAAHIQGIYTEAEHLLAQVMAQLGDELRETEDWPTQLLETAATDLPQARPAILSEETLAGLKSMLKMRHRIQSSYAGDLGPARILGFVPEAREAIERTIRDLKSFAQGGPRTLHPLRAPQ